MNAIRRCVFTLQADERRMRIQDSNDAALSCPPSTVWR